MTIIWPFGTFLSLLKHFSDIPRLNETFDYEHDDFPVPSRAANDPKSSQKPHESLIMCECEGIV